MYRNKIRFKGEVNGKECHMTLDNGSLWDELLFFGSPKVDTFGFAFSEETSIGMMKADVDSDVTIRVGDIIFYDQRAVVSRYEKDRPHPWEGFDGQFSATFFKHFVVKIHFDESLIELIPPEDFAYDGKGESIDMKMGPYNSRTISAEIVSHDGAVTRLDLLIDLGGLFPLYLPLGRHEAITRPPDAVEAGLGTGFVSQEGSLGRVKSVRFGKYVLKDVTAAFIQVDKDSDIFGNTMMGLPLLLRFNLIFNYFENKIILEPSKSFDTPFVFPRSGQGS